MHIDDEASQAAGDHLTVLGMNRAELQANPMADRLFPTKAVAGWLHARERDRPQIVAAYIERAGGFGPVTAERRRTQGSDPLWGVWARRNV